MDAPKQRVFPNQSQHIEETQKHVFENHNPRRRIVGLVEESIGEAVYRFAMGQTAINETLIACALERYRLVHQQYPPTMEALAPQLITRPPHDIVNGQPLSYQATFDGRFSLSSAGWDQADSGAAPKDGTRGWVRTGDWAWRYPTPIPSSN